MEYLKKVKKLMFRSYLSLYCVLSDYLEKSAGHPIGWAPSLYPDLYTPISSSWSLHWTFRDERLVNVPVSLLVEGDVIALRPGQEAFASLRGIKVITLFLMLTLYPFQFSSSILICDIHRTCSSTLRVDNQII